MNAEITINLFQIFQYKFSPILSSGNKENMEEWKLVEKNSWKICIEFLWKWWELPIKQIGDFVQMIGQLVLVEIGKFIIWSRSFANSRDFKMDSERNLAEHLKFRKFRKLPKALENNWNLGKLLKAPKIVKKLQKALESPKKLLKDLKRPWKLQKL